MKMSKKAVRKNLITRLLRLCIFAFVVFTAILLVDMQVSIADKKQEIEIKK